MSIRQLVAMCVVATQHAGSTSAVVGLGRVISWLAEQLEDAIVNPGKINGYPPGELAEPCGATVRGTIRD